MPVGRDVVIIGGAIQGCQLAEYLVKRGRKVTLVETGDELGKWLAPERKTRLFYWFDKKGVERLTGVKLIEIHKMGLEIVTRDGQKRLLEADHIIPALPFAENNALRVCLRARCRRFTASATARVPGSSRTPPGPAGRSPMHFRAIPRVRPAVFGNSMPWGG